METAACFRNGVLIRGLDDRPLAKAPLETMLSTMCTHRV